MTAVIDWVMEKEAVCERSAEWALATTYGEVDGVRRFRVCHVGDGSEDRWEACQLTGIQLTPPYTMFRGGYRECVEWCWEKAVAEEV